MRVATYNIHGCVGTDGVRSPQRIRDVIAMLNADIVVLQEVANSAIGESPEPLLDWLAAELAMHAQIGQTLIRDDSAFGNACLARQRPAYVRRHDISVAGREPRGVMELRFDDNYNNLRLWATHLGLRRNERGRQYRQLGRLLAKNPDSPGALVGDFNDFRLPSRWLAESAADLSTARVRSFPTRAPLAPFDRIHVWPANLMLRVEAVRTPASRRASDHLPVVAEIDIEPKIDYAD